MRYHKMLSLAAAFALAVALMGAAAAENWTGFRGADRSGKAEAANLPTTWDSNKNIVWKTELPGLGTSSPIVVNGKIYLTAYSGYAENAEDPGDLKKLMRHLVCLDRASGKLLWSKEFAPVQPESEYVGRNNTRHGYASSTMTTDGEKLYMFLGISGVFCLDMDGNVLWRTDVGDGTHGWGSGTSPVLYENLLIVNASVESQSIVALDKNTGKEVWKVGEVKSCWSSPILVDVNGKQELVLNMPRKVAGFDPATGKELWFCEGLPDGYICPTAVANDGVVYVIGARKNTAMAIRAGGQGDVGATHVLWSKTVGSNVSSPVVVDGDLYWFHESKGKAYCLDGKTGEIKYEAELSPEPGLIYSSATFADGKIYASSQDNGTYVIAAKPDFELLAVNKFQDDPSRVNASLAVTDNQMLLRTDKALYCIGL